MSQDPAKARGAALEGALTQIERQFGKGAVMRMGDEGAPCRAVSRALPAGSVLMWTVLLFAALKSWAPHDGWGVGRNESLHLPAARNNTGV